MSLYSASCGSRSSRPMPHATAPPGCRRRWQDPAERTGGSWALRRPGRRSAARRANKRSGSATGARLTIVAGTGRRERDLHELSAALNGPDRADSWQRPAASSPRRQAPGGAATTGVTTLRRGPRARAGTGAARREWSVAGWLVPQPGVSDPRAPTRSGASSQSSASQASARRWPSAGCAAPARRAQRGGLPLDARRRPRGRARSTGGVPDAQDRPGRSGRCAGPAGRRVAAGRGSLAPVSPRAPNGSRRRTGGFVGPVRASHRFSLRSRCVGGSCTPGLRDRGASQTSARLGRWFWGRSSAALATCGGIETYPAAPAATGRGGSAGGVAGLVALACFGHDLLDPLANVSAPVERLLDSAPSGAPIV